MDIGTLGVINPDTFEQETTTSLYCPEIFSHPSLQMINKKFPILTDGEFLYIIGKRIVSKKIEPKKPEEEK